MSNYVRRLWMYCLNSVSFRALAGLLFTGALAACYPALTYGQDSRLPETPNILFILVDDMSWNGLSSFGNPHVSTPNIDRLAREGMKFTQAYVAPVCTPTRGEFLSGEYGARTGMTQVLTHRIYPNAPLHTPKALDKLPENTYTIANMLQEAGYATAISGKWHVGDAYRTANLKKKYGDSYFAPYGFDYVGDAVVKAWDKVDKDKAGMDIAENILQFIRQNRDRPFFAYAPFFNVHVPLQAPDSLVQKYIQRRYPGSTHRFGNATEKPTAEYLAMISYLDYSIGKLLDGLDEMELTDETMIIFMSDNGAPDFTWDNYPLRGAKGTLYEGGIHVPMLVRWPGIVPVGSQTDIPVHIVDMFPTFLEVAQGSIPDDKTLDGRSLVPVLTGTGGFKPRSLYWHHPHYLHDYGKTPSSAIRQGNYKLIYYYGDYLDTRGYMAVPRQPYGELKLGERMELFDLKKDPYEWNDLSESHPQKAEALYKNLMEWLAETNASMPAENPDAKVSLWYETATREQGNQ